MKKPLPLLLLALAALATAPLALCADDTAPAAGASAKLDVGSPAPEFKPSAWIQGEPVTKFEAGKTYLIECWATWCGPCVAQIPHVNGFHKKYADKGLVVIGMNVWDGPQENVEKFVKQQGDKMSYRIAFDGKENGFIAKNWLRAAGANGIPHAFVVRDGKIIWQGHPGELKESVVETMVAGKFDPAKFAADRKVAEERQAKAEAASGEAMKLVSEKKYDEALKKVDEIEALFDDEDKPQADLIRADIFAKKGDIDAALGRLAAVSKAAADNVGAQYAVANKILGDPAFKTKVAAALPYAKKAAALNEHPALKLLVAQAEYAAGNRDVALGDLEKLSKSPELKGSIKTAVSRALGAVKDSKPWPSDDEE